MAEIDENYPYVKKRVNHHLNEFKKILEESLLNDNPPFEAMIIFEDIILRLRHSLDKAHARYIERKIIPQLVNTTKKFSFNFPIVGSNQTDFDNRLRGNLNIKGQNYPDLSQLYNPELYNYLLNLQPFSTAPQNNWIKEFNIIAGSKHRKFFKFEKREKLFQDEIFEFGRQVIWRVSSVFKSEEANNPLPPDTTKRITVRISFIIPYHQDQHFEVDDVYWYCVEVKNKVFEITDKIYQFC